MTSISMASERVALLTAPWQEIDAELTCSAREMMCAGYPDQPPAEAVKVLRGLARPWADRR